MNKSNRKLRHFVAPTKLGRVMGLGKKEDRANKDNSQLKQSGSSQDSEFFARQEQEQEFLYNTGASNVTASEILTGPIHEQADYTPDGRRHTRSMSGHARSLSGPQSLSKFDELERIAQNVEGITKAIARLHQKNTEILQRQRTIENRVLSIGDYQKTTAAKLHRSLTELVSKVNGVEDELKDVRVLSLCSKVRKSQLAMMMFSQGLLSKRDTTSASVSAPTSPSSIMDHARVLQRRCKANPKLLILMAASLLNLIIAIFRTRVRRLPAGVHRALHCVQEVCKATSHISLYMMWDMIREFISGILKWMGSRL